MAVVRLLGPVDVVDSDGMTHTPGSPIRATVLALLVLEVGKVIQAERLLEMTWDGQPPASGLRALRFHISKLRSDVPIQDLITTIGSGYRLNAETDLALAQNAAAASLLGADDLRHALGAWRGDPLSGTRHCGAIEHEQRRIAELRLSLTERMYHSYVEEGNAATIVVDLRRVCLDNPLREGLWASLIVAQYQANNQAAALRSYEQLRLNLAESLGVEPSRELKQLERKILTHDAKLADVSAATATNLPAAHEPLIGRSDDLTRLTALMTEHRLTTVVGVGGIGKTRLAFEAARTDLEHHPDGVWVCELASIGEPHAVAQAVGQVLGTRQHPNRSMEESIAEFCKRRELLLVLDNCEHVLDAAASLAARIIATANRSRILSTSREALGLAGEQCYPLASLKTSELDQGAVSLFIQRASESRPGRFWTDRELKSIRQICRRLDGMPLAIELAARRTQTLSPSEILDQVDDAFRIFHGGRGSVERHRTLEAAVGWSYDSLTSDSQALFCRLSVFASGFDLAAAVAVGSDSTDDPVASMERLESLAAKSFVTVDTPADAAASFRLLEPLRQFAEDRLGSSGDADVARHAHLDYYTRWAADWSVRLPTDGLGWRQELEREFPNLRVALVWAVRSGDVTRAVGLIRSLYDAQALFLLYEIGDWATSVLEMPGVGNLEGGPIVATTAAMSHFWRSDFEAFHRYVELAVAMPARDATHLYPAALEALSRLLEGNGLEGAHALTSVDRSDDHTIAVASWLRIVLACSDPGLVKTLTPDADLASLERVATASDSGIHWSMYDLCAGRLALVAGDHRRAATHARSGIDHATRVGADFFTQHNVVVLGEALAPEGAISSSDLDILTGCLIQEHDAGQETDQWLLLAVVGIGLFRRGHIALAHKILAGLQETTWSEVRITQDLAHLLAGHPRPHTLEAVAIDEVIAELNEIQSLEIT